MTAPDVPRATAEVERRINWRALSLLLFLAALVGLGVVAALSQVFRPRQLEGLPDDPRARAARDTLSGALTLGFDGLRFTSALTGPAGRSRPVPRADPARLERAERLLREVEREHPLEARASASLAHVELARRHFDRAERLYRHALDLNAHCSEARLGLGVALAERALTQPDPLQARALELRAVAQFAGVRGDAQVYPEALYDRAMLLARVGRALEAQQRAREYFAGDDTSAWAGRLAAEVGFSGAAGKH
jgi:tetratricopeptide (TPR) repeat protein